MAEHHNVDVEDSLRLTYEQSGDMMSDWRGVTMLYLKIF